MKRTPSPHSINKHLQALTQMHTDYQQTGQLRRKVEYASTYGIAIPPPNTNDFIQEVIHRPTPPVLQDVITLKKLIVQYVNSRKHHNKQATPIPPTLQDIATAVSRYNKTSTTHKITLTIN